MPKGKKSVKNFDKIRHPGTIITSLSSQKSSQKISTLDPYLCCRMGMRPDKQVPSIPDGASGKHVTVCLFNYDTISTTVDRPWSFTFQTTPTLPIGSVISSVDPIKVNGRNIAPYVRYPLSLAPAFMGSQAYAGVPGSPSNNNDVYDAASYRIISMRYKITYTGPAVEAAGSLLAYPTGLSFQPIGESNTTSATAAPPASGRYARIYRADGLANNYSYCRSGTEIVYADGIKIAGLATYPPSTTSFRPEQRIVIVPRHKTGTYRNIPVRDTAVCITTAMTQTGDTVEFPSWTSSTSADAGGWFSGVIAYDEDWESIIVDANDLNSAGSYLIETCICVEFSPKPTSAFYALSKDSVNKPSVMAQAVKQQSTARPVFNDMGM